MRVLVDTNILFSAFLFPGSVPAAALVKASTRDTLVLCDYVINELERVISNKRPDLLTSLGLYLAKLPHESICAPRNENSLIADAKDAPILNAAIDSAVDIIISGDSHFRSLKIKRPKVLTAAEYLRL